MRKSLFEGNPKLSQEWHPTRNDDLKPTNVTEYSRRKAWWICIKGHVWQASVSHRSNGSGCPYCSGLYVIPGESDLATKRPDIAAEWHPILNDDLKSTDVSSHSNRKVWWLCIKGHAWPARVSHRSEGSGCPYCSGLLAIPGESDLDSLRPDLAAEWHPILNGDLKPANVTVNSNRKVWWCCKKGHKWQVSINNRSNGNGCPYCSGLYAIPGESDLVTLRPDIAAEWHPILNGDLKPTNVTSNSNKKVWWCCKKGHKWQASVTDRSNGSGCPYCSGLLAIPSETDLATLRPDLAAEWHPTLNGDLKPMDVTAYSNKKVWWCCKKGHKWKSSINNRNKGNGCPYCSRYYVIPGESDLATLRPDLAAEWHPTLNGDLKPMDVTAYSNKKFWWECKKGHQWKTTINNRSNGNGCPYCSGLYVIPGESDLATLRPDIAAEWHLALNGDLKPVDVSAVSHRKIWWICKKGHLWQASISNRSKGNGCPYCSGLYVIPGESDLVTIRPDLAAEWHLTLNGDLKPMHFSVYSNRKIWWSCKKGHEWQASIYSRAEGSGCPYCSGLYVIPGESDLTTKRPDLAAEWHSTLNGNLKPSNVTSHSGRKVWWNCKKGHVWQASINNRSKGRGCPYCSGLYAIPGESDLATLRPDLAAEWHSTQNGDLNPMQVTVYSDRKVWWNCKKDHEWQATISSRFAGCGCPYCYGKRFNRRNRLSKT